MPNSQIADLLYKLHNGELTDEEKIKLEKWVAQSKENQELYDLAGNDPKLIREIKNFYSIPVEIDTAELLRRIAEKKVIPMRRGNGWLKILVAAAIMGLLVLSGIKFFVASPAKDQLRGKVSQNTHEIIQPGSARAVLTLASGQKIYLDSSGNGELAQQGQVHITKSGEEISYNGAHQEEMLWNTISTPVGSEYTVVLPDLTRVRLNAQSSIRFPVAFAGNERRVEITGEAYFEVSHNANKPFRVSYNDMTVEVLGTHFNINTYSDEDGPRTTLLEGKVKITNGQNIAVLTPGMQVHRLSDGRLQVLKDVDVDKSVAWTKGVFQFDDDDMKVVMRQVARWYNINVAYEDNYADLKITGKIHRNSTLDEFLNVLTLLKVPYELKGRTIIIKK